jgi:hypothetical protein
MSLPEVKVKPNEDFCAEVVILVTTLGTKRTEFNAGKRAKDLLEIKRVHYKVRGKRGEESQGFTGDKEGAL